MRLLLTLDSLNRGGVETLMLDVCRAAPKFGYDVTFVATGTGDLEGEFRKLPDAVFLERKFVYDPFLVARLRRLLIERKINVIHANQAVEALHVWHASRGLPVKVVLTLHNLYYDRKNHAALRFLLPRLDAVICVGEAQKEKLSERFNLGRAVVIPNAVNPDRLGGVSRLREELELTPDAFLFGMIANFTPVKDHLTVSRALPTVFERLPEARFVFAGAPHHRELYEEAVFHCSMAGITNRVHFIGARPAAEVLPALDAFVLSSRSDTFGIALVEAMVAGIPAIASDIPALRETSDNGRAGALFRPGHVGGLAETMISIAKDGERRAALAERARAFARRRFTLDAYFKQIKHLHESFDGGRPR